MKFQSNIWEGLGSHLPNINWVSLCDLKLHFPFYHLYILTSKFQILIEKWQVFQKLEFKGQMVIVD